MNLKKFKTDLKKLLKEYNVELEVDIDGDTHGISTQFVVYDKGSNKTYVLNDYSTTLDASDL